MVADNRESRIRTRLRAEIAQYLERYPLAGDTVNGILRCWLPSRGFEVAPEIIAEVVDEMVAAGQLVARHMVDGRVLYTRGSTPPPAE